MKKIKHKILFLCIFCTSFVALWAQQYDTTLVQLTGVALQSGTKNTVPFVSVNVRGTSRSAIATPFGFFSIVARKGETIQIFGIGYRVKSYTLPKNLKGNTHFVTLSLEIDEVALPEALVIGIPSRENFKSDFLALNTESTLEARIRENLDPERVELIRNSMRMDGTENTAYYLRQQAAKTYYTGQSAPQNIFNVFAWGEFMKAVKRGDFKKKKRVIEED